MRNRSQLELFTDLQISLNYSIILKKIYLNSTKNYREIYCQGDFKINLFENGNYAFDKSSSNNKNLNRFTKKHHEYCTLFDLKQLIKCLTRVTCKSSSILDHVLASFPDSFSRSGVINGGISDHQLIYCTRKDTRIKTYCHKQITFRSLKSYSLKRFMKRIRQN